MTKNINNYETSTDKLQIYMCLLWAYSSFIVLTITCRTFMEPSGSVQHMVTYIDMRTWRVDLHLPFKHNKIAILRFMI